MGKVDDLEFEIDGFSTDETLEIIKGLDIDNFKGLCRVLDLINANFPKADIYYAVLSGYKKNFCIGKRYLTMSGEGKPFLIIFFPTNKAAHIKFSSKFRKRVCNEIGKMESFFKQKFLLKDVAEDHKYFEEFLNTISKSPFVMGRANGNKYRPDDYVIADEEKGFLMVVDNIKNIFSGKGPITAIQQRILARHGQGKFRKDVLELWENTCAITGSKTVDILKASHIRPWHNCHGNDHFNPKNGLLLVATLNALFDRWLITFEDNGEMLVSKRISAKEQKLLGLPSRLLKKLDKEQKKFLIDHRIKFWACESVRIKGSPTPTFPYSDF